jgi:hypothetical protein
MAILFIVCVDLTPGGRTSGQFLHFWNSKIGNFKEMY